MEETEVMGGVNSESNGLMDLETPSEQPSTETPAETVETEPTTDPVKEPELFELPDGRKVEAPVVIEEYKNLLSDYTKKSQELAKVKPETITTNEPAKNPLADPEYQPQTYEELAAQIEARTLAKLEAKEQERIAAQQALEDTVASQLSEVKTIDPSVNETALFLHASKYQFRDLKLAHQNMKDMAELAKNVQQTTAKNIAKRADPVSMSPGAGGTRPDPSQFSTAREYLRSLNN